MSNTSTPHTAIHPSIHHPGVRSSVKHLINSYLKDYANSLFIDSRGRGGGKEQLEKGVVVKRLIRTADLKG